MSTLKINLELVRNIGNSLQGSSNKMASVSEGVTSIHIDSQIAARRGIGSRLNQSRQMAFKLQSDLRELQSFIDSSSQKYENAENRIQNMLQTVTLFGGMSAFPGSWLQGSAINIWEKGLADKQPNDGENGKNVFSKLMDDFINGLLNPHDKNFALTSLLIPFAKFSVIGGLIKFKKSMKYPGLFSISTKLAYTKAALSYRSLVGKMPGWLGFVKGKVPGNLSGVVKQFVGVNPNYTSNIGAKLLMGGIKKFPVLGAAIEGGTSIWSIGSSVKDNWGKDRNTFWKNVSADSASSLWRGTLKVGLGWAGAVAGGALGSAIAPGPGTLAGGVGGAYLGQQLGGVITDTTDKYVRQVGESIGGGISKAMDFKDSVAKKIDSIIDVKWGFSS